MRFLLGFLSLRQHRSKFVQIGITMNDSAVELEVVFRSVGGLPQVVFQARWVGSTGMMMASEYTVQHTGPDPRHVQNGNNTHVKLNPPAVMLASLAGCTARQCSPCFMVAVCWRPCWPVPTPHGYRIHLHLHVVHTASFVFISVQSSVSC